MHTCPQHICHVDPNKSTSKIMYPPCKSHTDCDKKQYCAIKCFTGGCGIEGDVEKDFRGLFCQPCKKCEFLGSVTRTCKVCKNSQGGSSMSLRARHTHDLRCVAILINQMYHLIEHIWILLSNYSNNTTLRD